MALDNTVTPIHYRKGGKLTHCGVECLPEGKDIERIIIEKIELKDNEMVNGRTENGVWIAYFAPNPYTSLPFILNATNRKRLAKLFPECGGYINMLRNVPVRLTKEKARDVQDGGETEGLRISKIPAAEPKKKVLTAEAVLKVVEWAKSNGKDIAYLKSVYQISADIEKDIVAELNKD